MCYSADMYVSNISVCQSGSIFSGLWWFLFHLDDTQYISSDNSKAIQSSERVSDWLDKGLAV